MIRTALALLLLLATPLLADDAPYLVRDFPGSLTPRSSLVDESFWTTIGDTTWFVADARDGWGRQLWKTDGTEEGTVQVTQVAAPRSGHAVRFVGVVNGRLVYHGDDYDGGRLFAMDLDGSHRDTLMRDTTTQSGFSTGVMYKGELYFPANGVPGNRTGAALGKTDGTVAGTTFLALNEGLLDYSVGSRLTVVGNSILFAGRTSAGWGVFLTDGTRAGTTRVVPLPADILSFLYPIAFGNKVLFEAEGRLWITDGTAHGTVVLLDIVRGDRAGLMEVLGIVEDGRLVIRLIAQNYRPRIWITDGTPAGTQPFDLVDDGWRYFPDQTVNGKHFVAFDADPSTSFRYTLFTTTAVPGVPTKLMDGIDSHAFVHAIVNGRYYFTTSAPQYGREWWSSDGTVAGTHREENLGPDTYGPMTPRGDGMLMFANEKEGREPWLFTGTSAKLLKNIAPDVPLPSSNPQGLRAGRDQLFFFAEDGYDVVFGRSNGSAGGTKIEAVRQYRFTTRYDIVASGNRYYFSTDQGVFSTDGTDAGTVRHSTYSSNLVAFRDGVVFTEPSDRTVRFTDGTLSGTRVLEHANPEQLFVANDVVWMRIGSNIATTDGVAPMKLVTPSPELGYNVTFAAGPANTTYFTDNVGSTARLWLTDGTTDGTRIVKTFESTPTKLIASADKLFFIVNGTLWVSDGTEAGTVQLPATGTPCVDAQTFAVARNQLFWFTGSEPGKMTLWQSNGTAAGTVPRMSYATVSPGCTPIAVFRDRVYFSAFTTEQGYELWRSDGTSEGTHIVADIFPGLRGSEPKELTSGAGHLFFTADTPGKGRELWAIGDRELPRRRGVRK